MLSKRCIYGLQAVLYLAARKGAGYVPIRQISDDLGLSYPFLTKVLQQLTRKGLMRSFRGPRGGVTLAQAPETMTVRTIIDAIDGPERIQACILGFPECTADNPCALHEQWGPVREEIVNTFSQTSLQDLVAQQPKPEKSHTPTPNKDKIVLIPK